MKKFFVGAVLFLGTQFMFSQAWNGKGDQKAQVALNIYGSEGLGVKGSYDYGVADAISVGAGVGFFFGDKNENSDFTIHGRANYHLQDALNLDDRMDIYPGITMGIVGNSFDFGAHVGFRYFFTDKFGAFIEVGNRGGLGLSINL